MLEISLFAVNAVARTTAASVRQNGMIMSRNHSWYHERLWDIKFGAPLFLMTYSVQYTAVFNGSIGLSLKRCASSAAFCLYLQVNVLSLSIFSHFRLKTSL